MYDQATIRFFTAARDNFMKSGYLHRPVSFWQHSDHPEGMTTHIEQAISKWWFGETDQQTISVCVPESLRPFYASQTWGFLDNLQPSTLDR